MKMKALLKTILILVIVCSESESFEFETCSTEGCKLGATEMASWMNASVNPCENFYDFACGSFDKVHPVIDDPSRFRGKDYPTAFKVMGEKIYTEFLQVLTSMSSTDDKYPRIVRFLGHAYQSCVKAANIQIEEEVESLKMLYEYFFQRAAANATWQNLWIYSQARSGFLIKALLEINIAFNSSESHKVINITLPKYDRFYKESVPKQKPDMLSLGKLVCSMQSSKPTSCLDENMEKIVDEVINLELAIVSLGNSSQDTKSSKVLLKDVNSLVGFDFKHTLRKLFHIIDVLDRTDDPDLEFSFSNVEYIKELNKRLTNTSADILQAYFGWKLLSNYGGLLSKSIENATYFTNKFSYDSSHANTRESYCLGKVNEFMPKNTYLYIVSLQSLPDEHRAVAEELVNHIKDVVKDNLATNDWLDEPTREKALYKLSKMGTHVGLPQSMKTYAEESDDQYGVTDPIYRQLISAPNYLISLFKLALMIERTNYLALDQLTELDDTDSWKFADFVPNAQYFPESNEVKIYIPMLRPSVFSPDRLAVLNYGHLGTTIGHEFTHGFDPDGSKYDATGKKHNWWSATARDRFERRSECFKNDANSFKEPVTGLFVNGTLCIGEIVADAGGLRLAYTAFQQHQKHEAKMWKLGEGLSNFTPEQLFFIAYAQNFCKIVDKTWAPFIMSRDPHPPSRYRIDGTVRNYDKWYDAFGCKLKKNNGMVMCKLW